MIDLGIIGERYTIKNDKGDVINEVSLLDLYYSISLYLDSADGDTQVDKMRDTASKLNNDYGTNFSWGEVAALFEILHTKLEESKKNFIDT